MDELTFNYIINNQLVWRKEYEKNKRQYQLDKNRREKKRWRDSIALKAVDNK